MTTPENTDQTVSEAEVEVEAVDTFVPGDIDTAVPTNPDAPPAEGPTVEGPAGEAEVTPEQAAAFGIGEDNPPPPPGPNSPPVDEDNAPLDLVEFDPEAEDGDDLAEVDPAGSEPADLDGLPDVDEGPELDPEADAQVDEDEAAAEAADDNPFTGPAEGTTNG